MEPRTAPPTIYNCIHKMVLNCNSIINEQNNSGGSCVVDIVNNSKILKGPFIEELSVEFDNYLDPVEIEQDIITAGASKEKNTHKDVNLDHQKNVELAIGKWAVDFNVPQNSLNALLKILKNEAGLDFLAKDCRTLLHNKSTKILNLRTITDSASYYHFGLSNGIERCSSIFPLSVEIKIAIGIDGSPLSKCSSSQFWPILAYTLISTYIFTSL